MTEAQYKKIYPHIIGKKIHLIMKDGIETTQPLLFKEQQGLFMVMSNDAKDWKIEIQKIKQIKLT